MREHDAMTGDIDEIFAGGGEMGALMRSIDWAATPLGAVEAWPISLRALVRTMLQSPSAVVVWWGKDLVSLYNDAYRRLLGDKHPRAMGARAAEVWREHWDELGPKAQSVLEGGPATRDEHLPLLIRRRDSVEEAYWTLSCSAAPDDQGRVGGLFVAAQDTTGLVQRERQLRMLSELGAQAPQGKTIEEVCRRAAAVLEGYDADIPFALFYVVDESGAHATLAGAASMGGFEGPAMAAQVSLEADSGSWPLAAVGADTDAGVAKVTDLSARFGKLPGGRWATSSETAVILRLGAPGDTRTHVYLIAGLSPSRPFDASYRRLFRLLADQLSRAIGAAHALEEQRQRAESLSVLDQAQAMFFSHGARAQLQLDDARVRRAAEAERDRLRALLSQVPAIVNFLRGPELVFEFAHPMTTRAVGGRQVIGKPLLEAIPELRDQEYPKLLKRVLETGERIQGKAKLVRLDADGSGLLRDTFWDFVYLPVRDDRGRIEGVMTFDVDVTEQTRAEAEQQRMQRQREDLLAAVSAARGEAERANKTKDEFLATLGHELRTPLTAIQLWGDALRAGNVPSDKTERVVDAILTSARSQMRLIDDLLDLSRLASGKLLLAPAPTVVADVARACINIVQPMARAKQQTLELDEAPHLGSAVLDASRLQQVLWNLLTNAIKFTPPGGKVTLRIRRARGMLEAEIEDTGEGIAPEFFPHLFERFRQADAGESRQRAGLGIGLALSRKLMELQGGSIEAHSEGRGRGSVFRVRMPLIDARSTPAPDTRPEPVEPLPPTVLPGVTVLLVEDHQETRDAMAWTLTHAGANVLQASSGAEALTLLDAVTGEEPGAPMPDVIVSDLGLPGMSGYELIEYAVELQRNRGREPIPACAVSAHARDVDRRRAIESGFDLYLPKPVTSEQLLEAVQDLSLVARGAP